MQPTPEIIVNALLPFQPVRHVYIAYSGGADSHVLLHLAAGIENMRGRMTAVHIHHGLQPEADAWEQHAETIARNLTINYRAIRVDASASKGESPEEAARNARYSALKTLLEVGDILLVAHHQDDQLESILLQLLRGAGLRGLSGMPESMLFGRGHLLRPLLKTSKQAICAYASSKQLSVIHDPSNCETDFNRNYLRHEVLPLLTRRWPSCAVTVSRAAEHCAQAERMLANVAQEDFDRVFNVADKTLSISLLQDFDQGRQLGVLRHWFSYFGLKMPSQIFLQNLLNQLVGADSDRQPEMINQGRSIRRYRDKIYCLQEKRAEQPLPIVWPQDQQNVSIGHNQKLSWRLSTFGIPLSLWREARIEIRYRSGSEKIAVPGRNGRHSLKKLYQEAGIPPWRRQWIPLIYLNDELAAVGSHWLNAKFHAEIDNGCVAILLEESE